MAGAPWRRIHRPKITRLAAPAGIDIHVIARRQEILSDQSFPSVDES